MSNKDRLPKAEYFLVRYQQATLAGQTEKAAYYMKRLEELGAVADLDPVDPTERIKAFIEDRTAQLDRSIIGTPSDDYLDSFASANMGSNDYLLMQMAKQRGYQMALEDIAEIMNLKTEKI